MKYLKIYIKTLVVFVVMAAAAALPFDASATSNRKERRMVSEGNELFKKGRFTEAAEKYQMALKIEPESKEALYNLGLTYIRRANTAQSDSLRRQLVEAGAEAMQSVSQVAKDKPSLAADALYNLGNIAFNMQDYSQAIEMYKHSLRIRPEDEKTRRNLRIAQKKLKQNKDDNQDKDNNKDKDQDKEKEQDKNKDQNQNQNQQQDQRQPEINPQAAEQILKAMENKENQTRARVNRNGQKAAGKSSASKRW